jgi:hypothetical protein
MKLKVKMLNLEQYVIKLKEENLIKVSSATYKENEHKMV